MSEVLRMELRKVLTTRMWWLLALLLLGYMAFLGAAMAFSLSGAEGGATLTGDSSAPPLAERDVALSAYTLAASLGYVFPLVVGALSMTGEFRHQTITATLLAEPRRTRVLLAKLAAGLAVGLVHGVAGTLGAVLGGAPVLALRDQPLFLGDGEVLTQLVFSVLALAVWAVIGVGLGTLLTNQVAAVVVILAFTQFVEPILRLGLTAVSALEDVAKLLPGAAAEAMVGSSLYSASGLLDLLPRAGGTAVLLGYAALFAVLGRVTTLRRDIS
ncbi:ABC transporter permease subunit [Nocardioides ferulae]|uniref:ABC transporter permease subunit n=1 Tax=Nocardioides ferulae TaxID=2340821 RepID=UPI000EB1C45A|nr:ABC transporter permease subunit [Nocardioides ferulae]